MHRNRCRARRCGRASSGTWKAERRKAAKAADCRRRPSRAARRTVPAGTAGRAPRVEPRPDLSPISLRLRWRPASSSDRFERVSRAKVQTSLTSATVSGSPSITVAGPVARRRDQLADDAQRHMRLAALHLGRDDVGLVDADEGRLDLFRPRLAVGDRRDETVIDLARQQVLQRLPVAVGIGHDDHLVGHLGAVDESLRIEGRVGVLDRAQALVEVGAGLGEGVDRLVGFVVDSPAPRLRGSETTFSDLAAAASLSRLRAAV